MNQDPLPIKAEQTAEAKTNPQRARIRALRLQVEAAQARQAAAQTVLPHIPGFEMVRAVHQGGQGEVFEAVQQSTGQRVALKLLYRADLDFQGRFRREVEALAKLRHPGIVTIHDTGNVERRLLLVMDYIDGRRLDQFMLDYPDGMPAREAVNLVADICDAVAVAHEEKILHRDLKPANIIVDQRGRPHLIDFGLAKFYEQEGTTVTKTESFVGTVAWSSPEQLDGQDIDGTTDVYSLGMILYYLLRKDMPYPSVSTLSRMIQIVRTQEPARPSVGRRGIGRDVDAIVLKCLEKDRRKRYQSAGALGKDLRRYLAGEPVEAHPPSFWYRTGKKLWKHRLRATLVAIIVCGFVATSLFTLVWRSREQSFSHTSAWQEYKNSIQVAENSYARNQIGPMQRALGECPKELRGWEWYHLDYLCDQSTDTFAEHKQEVLDLAIDPKGRWLASASMDKTVVLWDLIAWKVSRTLRGHDGPVKAISFSRDGYRLVSAGDDTTARVWNVLTGQELQVLKGHQQSVAGVAFCDRDNRILSYDDGGKIMLWDAVSGNPVQPRPDYSEIAGPMRIASMGDRIVAKSADGVVMVFHAGTGQILGTINRLDPESAIIAVSPNGRWLASVGHDKVVKLWDVDSPALRGSLVVDDSRIRAIAFSQDGRLVAAGAEDKTLRVWDCAKPAESGSLRAIKTLRGHADVIDCIACMPDGRHIVTGGKDFKVKIWDTEAPDCTRVLAAPNVHWAAISPDNKWIVSAASQPEPMHVWDAVTGQVISSFGKGRATRRCVAFSPKSYRIVAVGEDGSLEQWEFIPPTASANAEVRFRCRFRAHAPVEGVGSRIVTFSPNGSIIATGGNDNTVKLWRLCDDTPWKTFEHDGGDPMAWVWALAFSPDGKTLASGSYDQTIRLWNLETADWSVIRDSKPIHGLAFSPDGTRIVAARTGNNQPLKVYDVATKRPLLDLIGHTRDCYGVGWSPDGTRIVSCNADATARVWDAQTGDSILTLYGHKDYVESAMFSPDGNSIITAGGGEIRIWGTRQRRGASIPSTTSYPGDSAP